VGYEKAKLRDAQSTSRHLPVKYHDRHQDLVHSFKGKKKCRNELEMRGVFDSTNFNIIRREAKESEEKGETVSSRGVRLRIL